MAAAVSPLEAQESEEEGLSREEHLETAWILNEARISMEDLRVRLKQAFPEDVDKLDRCFGRIRSELQTAREILATKEGTEGIYAQVAGTADAAHSKCVVRKGVRVRIPPCAQ